MPREVGNQRTQRSCVEIQGDERDFVAGQSCIFCVLRIPIVAVEVLEHMCNIIAPPVVSVRSNIAEKALVDWLLVGEHVVVLNDDKVLVLDSRSLMSGWLSAMSLSEGLPET